jgi:TRAP-type C4-dicarboxylate transport system permease small subunit
MKSRRRHTPDEGFYDDEGLPTLLEVVIEAIVDPVMKSTVGRLKSGVQTAVDWTLKRVVAGGVVTGILIVGLVLVLAAGVKGLEALRCPVWLSYLAIGIVAVAAALFFLRRMLARLDDELD